MSEADKLLLKLGFKLVTDEDNHYSEKCLQYEDSENTLCFYLDERDITYNKTNINSRLLFSPGINMELLYAIVLKCKELGWL